MSLRTFILYISGGIIAVMVGLFYLQTQRILGNVFSDLDTMHLSTVSHTAQSILQAKQYSLRTYLSLLENNNELSSALLVAKEHNHLKPLIARLHQLQTNLKTDLVDIIYYDGSAIEHTELSKSPEKAGFSIRPLNNQLYLLSFSPLRNYGENVGTLVLGYELNTAIAEEISRTTKVKSTFTADPSAEGSRQKADLELESGSAAPLHATLLVDSRYISDLNAQTRSNITLVGVGSLLLMLVLLYALLEWGFVRRFKGLLVSIQRVANDLDRDLVREFAPSRHPIREVDNLSQSFGKFSSSLTRFKERIEEQSKQEAFIQVAEQVAHDLKSPLSALDMMITQDGLAGVPEKKQTRIVLCIDRIREIIRTLAAKKERPTVNAPTPVVSTLESLLAEKRVQYQKSNVRITLASGRSQYGVFTTIPVHDLKRLLSNLIDNAAHASRDRSSIALSLEADQKEFRLSVTDEGKGISPEILPKLGERGATFGKEQGSGLGLWSAKQTVESHGGHLEIQSTVGKGTRVTLVLPIGQAPKWFVSQIALRAGDTLVILDDDPSILEMWKVRTAELGSQITVHYFQSGTAFDEWFSHYTGALEQTRFLFDFQLGAEAENGLQKILRHRLSKQATLITSHHERPEIQLTCAQEGIGLISKEAVASVALKVAQKTEGAVS